MIKLKLNNSPRCICGLWQADDKMRASCGWDGTDFQSLGDQCGIMQCGGKVVRNARSDGHTIHGARRPR